MKYITKSLWCRGYLLVNITTVADAPNLKWLKILISVIMDPENHKQVHRIEISEDGNISQRKSGFGYFSNSPGGD